jgi:hypothetical protein
LRLRAQKSSTKQAFARAAKADKLDRVRISRSNLNSKSGEDNAGFRQRFKKEMRTYAIVSLYLWICFSVLLLYDKSLLRINPGPAAIQ